jgi:hypothetical protein
MAYGFTYGLKRRLHAATFAAHRGVTHDVATQGRAANRMAVCASCFLVVMQCPNQLRSRKAWMTCSIRAALRECVTPIPFPPMAPKNLGTNYTGLENVEGMQTTNTSGAT